MLVAAIISTPNGRAGKAVQAAARRELSGRTDTDRCSTCPVRPVLDHPDLRR